MTGTLDHTMMRVGDLEGSIDWYRTHFGYELKDRYDGDGFSIAYLGPEGMGDEEAMLELTSNEGDDEVEIGDAWGHIAVRVRDLESAYEALIEGGVEDYRDPESCGGRYAFVKDPDGHEIELVRREQGSRYSIDHTMIRVEDADEALGFWARKFEYVGVGRWEADTFANFYVEPRGAADEAMSVELTYNYDGRSYGDGDGWGHLCVRVDDLHEDYERLVLREVPEDRDPASCNDLYAFVTDPDGHEIELLERDPDADSLFPF
ncbi:VOC family protein [Natronomonas sp.]|uniref:VOC family protein n=1 Tax=Natronomonas sp. TaxID=2184060 RepID=UPI00261638DF|nr:VOC family protein [Natronomonas sp.]